MAKKPTSTTTADSARKVSVAPVTTARTAGTDTVTPKKRTSPAKFIQEVRQEARKITWTSRKETWITTVMVLIMVLVACVFFYIIDGGLGFVVNFLINIGR
ncbi:preprotein translocase subunit SecE [Asticcacaulis sp. YBE204]|uniref:preprotein translocase subunit SecE n=1 Tax=Asticcacaulis sp. YBE204 TaxID=1282363 RepID=UPI0003C3CB1C|nr:preprotein translocase subunit SecE [Asticcacaulis sp. YBE204]ESQ78256.1 preprotein translocase subunit SecE [Asticcacaulis sp. YBE204]